MLLQVNWKQMLKNATLTIPTEINNLFWLIFYFIFYFFCGFEKLFCFMTFLFFVFLAPDSDYLS